MKKHSPIIDSYIRILTFIITCGLLNTLGLGERSQEYQMHYECSMEKLIVKGYNVRISDVNRIKCVSESIEIFALQELLIDSNIDKTGYGVQLSLISPLIKINGTRSIKLSGKSGKKHSPSKAIDGVGDGRHGKPGNPGISSGSFMAIGKRFLFEGQLKLYINGGDGGAGQDGGDGTKKQKFLYILE